MHFNKEMSFIINKLVLLTFKRKMMFVNLNSKSNDTNNGSSLSILTKSSPLKNTNHEAKQIEYVFFNSAKRYKDGPKGL